MIKNLLFDLDGTIINSQEGILRCLSYAMTETGHAAPSEEQMMRCIGPPLTVSLQRELGVAKERIWDVIAAYRKRYDSRGMYECSLYPGIADCLKALRAKGYGLCLTSSKNERACIGIMAHLGLTGYFDMIVGSSEDARVETKAEVLRECMARDGRITAWNAVLIGDTHFDAEGAAEVGMACVGVSYGFGTEGELLAAGACAVMHSAEEVRDYFAPVTP